ncbi:MAG: hypothetical protein SFW09_08715 [Hyphomicrobiaceae bacterium]|nr:hypothetical protein [Hyphomicrobiaceae bacterium]
MKDAGTGDDEHRILIDLSHAEREAQRIADLLASLRKRHDLTRFEYTRLVRIQPAGPTHSHPILTLGTRFADTEDMLLSTYLHEQMHWYLWRLGGPDHDPIAPFFDELVRRYPKAPICLPDGARSYEQTYLHLVVCWLEMAATTELIGPERAARVAGAPFGYRWIYRTVLDDREPLGELYRANGLLPLRTPAELDEDERERKRAGANGTRTAQNDTPRKGTTPDGPTLSVARAEQAPVSAGPRRRRPAAKLPPPRQGRRTAPARGDRSNA